MLSYIKQTVPRLYVFNPSYEGALHYAYAQHYLPRKEVVRMAIDLSPLLQLCMKEGDYLWLPEYEQIANHKGEIQLFSALPSSLRLTAWGWEPHTFRHLTKSLEKEKISLLCPPLHKEYYELAHRSAGVGLLQHLCDTLDYPSYLIPQWVYPKATIKDTEKALLETAERVHHNYPTPQLFTKQPYTSSGRGVAPQPYPISDFYVARLAQQCEKAGGISIEPMWEVEENWAAEFYISPEGDVSFIAWSYFYTGAGKKSYAGNRLCAQNELWKELYKNFGKDTIDTLVHTLSDYLKTVVSPHYQGYVGIDMFTYQEGNQHNLHPCVEINLRMTMGLLAHFAYERYVPSGYTGKFHILHSKKDLATAYLTIEKSLKSQGYRFIPLTLPTTESQFGAYIEIVG
ncbi:MAG: hypothetical protein SPJ29_06840 [Phocaeicola sp.]|nr:hypothetical protein [Phocaeicola sp.]MDD7447744.1 hypothetical protein [Prevotellaceae bacterium]MDY3914212.1 hypothetical protein [Phocaeicola sp.]MDY5939450.1 hypothetical protein [Phocaeicola sp.]